MTKVLKMLPKPTAGDCISDPKTANNCNPIGSWRVTVREQR